MVGRVGPIDGTSTEWRGCGHCVLRVVDVVLKALLKVSVVLTLQVRMQRLAVAKGLTQGHKSKLDPGAIWHHSPSKLCCHAASLQSARWWRMRAHCLNSRCFCIVSLNRALFSLCLPVRMKQRRWVVGAGTFWLFRGDLPPASYCPSQGKGLKLVGAFSPTPRPGISRPKSQTSW